MQLRACIWEYSSIDGGIVAGLDLFQAVGKDISSFVAVTVTVNQNSLKQIALKESGLLLTLLFFGFVFAPIAIFFVGQNVLGQFGGYGYSDFFGTLSARIRTGDLVAWFFVLSPYLIWQTLRLTVHAWRSSAAPKS